MAKRNVLTTKIPSIATSWDDGENAYSGEMIETFIKEQLQTKCGAMYFDDSEDTFLLVYGFKTVEDMESWVEDKTQSDLVLFKQTTKVVSRADKENLEAATEAANTAASKATAVTEDAAAAVDSANAAATAATEAANAANTIVETFQTSIDNEATARTNADKELEAKISANAADIDDLETAVDTLNAGATTVGSVDYKIAQAQSTLDGSIKEVSDSIGDGTITVTQTGNSSQTFTLNQSGNTTIALTDTKVTNTLATTTKAYVTGTTSEATNTGTQVFDTGVYLDTTAGQLTAKTFSGALSGNATTATKLATARTIALSGDVTGSASFNGSANATIAATLSDSGVEEGSYGPGANVSPAHGGTFTVPYVTVDSKGRVISASTQTITLPTDSNTDTKVTNTLATTTKAYVTGTTSSTTNTGTQVFDTGVYLDTTAGQLTATSFSGNGAALTSLNASNISSGTLAVARLATSGATAGSYGMSAATTGNEGTTVNIPYITVDAYGRVTSISNKVYTSKNTTYSVASGDQILSLSNNALSATIGIAYTEATSTSNAKISLTGINGEEIGSIDATAFVKDGMLESVDYDSTAKTITFNWNTDGEGTSTVIDISDLVDTYKAGTGLSLSSNTFSLAASGVTAGSYGMSAATTGSEGTTINIPYITVDTYGRVTSISNKVYTSKNTTYTSLKNPYSLALQASGTSVITYDGSAAKTFNIATGSTNGTISVGGTDVSVYGLGSAAYTASTAYATASHTHSASDITSGTLAVARLATSGVTAGSYGPSANVSGSNGNTLTVPYITVDAYGRVTSIVNKTYTSVNTDTNTTYSAGTGIEISDENEISLAEVTKLSSSSTQYISFTTGTGYTYAGAVTTNSYGQVTGVTSRSVYYPLIAAGDGVAITTSGGSSGPYTYTFAASAATSTTLGGVMLGSDTVQTVAANSVTTTSSRTYAVQANSSGQLVVNVPWSNTNTDTKVTNTLATTTKAYITGTTTATTNTGTQVFDTGVYLDTTAGQLVATTFSGSGASLTSLNASNISSGTLAAARLATSGVTAGSYGPSANVSGANGNTINVPYITVDAYGRVTSISNKVYTSVNTDTDTTYSAGTGIEISDENEISLAEVTKLSSSSTQYISFTTGTGYSYAGAITSNSYGQVTGVTTRSVYYPLIAAGDGVTITGSGGSSGPYTYTFAASAATSTTLGGVMLGSDTVQTVAANSVSTTSSRTYAVQANSSGQLVVNVPWSNTNTDTKVTNTLATTTKAYVTGTTSATTNTGTQIFDTGIYIDSTAGTLVATTFSGALSGNATTATTLATSRTIALSGDATGSASFNGSANATIATTLASSGVTAGSYGPSASASPAHGGTFTVPYITVDAKGRVTSASTKTITLPADNNTDTTYSAGTGIEISDENEISLAAVTKLSSSGTQYISFTTGTGYSYIGGVASNSYGQVTSVTTRNVYYPLIAAGDGVTITGSGGSSGPYTYTFAASAATSTTLGGVMLGSDTVQTVAANSVSTTSSRTYAVQVNSDGQMVVNVPWSNTNTDTKVTNTLATTTKAYITGTASSTSNTGTQYFDTGVYLTTTAGQLHATTFDGSGANLTNLNASNIASGTIGAAYLPSATSTTLGGVMLGSDTVQTVAANSVTTTSSRTYAVQVNSDGQMVVNVPWTNTNTDTKVTNTLATTTQVYLTGTSSSTTNTGTQYFDTGVYLTTTAGQLHATSFDGSGANLTSLNASNISSGTLAAARLASSGVTAGSYGPSASASPAHAGTFSVPYITVDAYGRVTAASTMTITLPSDNNTDTKVTNTLATTTKAYVTGTTSSTTNTGTQVFDTGVYLDTTAGKLVATTFSGSGASLTSLNASNISSGTLAAARLATSGVTAGSYGPSANVSGTNGTTISVPYITVDSYGRVTSISNKTYTSVNTDTNTTYSAGTGIAISSSNVISIDEGDVLAIGDIDDSIQVTAYMRGVLKLTSVADIMTGSYRLVVATISTSETFALHSAMAAGEELVVIVKNSSTSDITITIPNSGSYVSMDGSTSLTVAGSGYAEINVISDGTTMYIRTA